MPDQISLGRRNFGRFIIWGSAIFLILTVLLQSLDQTNFLTFGFENWRPTLYAYLLWAFCLCLGQVILYGEQGKRRLFILPAVLFVISVVIFPLIFALGIAFSSWNLSTYICCSIYSYICTTNSVTSKAFIFLFIPFNIRFINFITIDII